MDQIHETLFILHKCNLNLTSLLNAGLEHQQGVIKSVNHFTNNLAYYMILESVSFVDEYNKFFVPSAFNGPNKDKTARIRKVARPILRTIDDWDLRHFRDNVIAHGFRKKGKFILPQDNQYNVPRNWLDLRFLKDLIGYVYELVKIEFGSEINEALWHADSLKQQVDTKPNIAEINTRIKAMAAEANQIMVDTGQQYTLSITTYIEG